jgi:hypothetical protein
MAMAWMSVRQIGTRQIALDHVFPAQEVVIGRGLPAIARGLDGQEADSWANSPSVWPFGRLTAVVRP